MTEKTKIDILKNMKVGEEILVNDVKRILLHFSEEKKIVYVKDVSSIDGSSIKVDLSDVSFLQKENNSLLFQKMLTLLASLSLSSVSAFMTIVGFMNFFYFNKLIIGILFGAIELVKFVSATIVFNNIHISKHHKIGLFFFLSVLIVISTIGHYSYLSQSYFSNQETANAKVNIVQDKIALIKSNIKDKEQENLNLTKEVETIPESKKTLRVQMMTKNNTKIKENNEKIALARTELMKLSEKYAEETSSAVDKKAAKNTFGENNTKYAIILIFLLAVIIDPLAFYFAYIFGTFKGKK